MWLYCYADYNTKCSFCKVQSSFFFFLRHKNLFFFRENCRIMDVRHKCLSILWTKKGYYFSHKFYTICVFTNFLPFFCHYWYFTNAQKCCIIYVADGQPLVGFPLVHTAFAIVKVSISWHHPRTATVCHFIFDKIFPFFLRKGWTCIFSLQIVKNNDTDQFFVWKE